MLSCLATFIYDSPHLNLEYYKQAGMELYVFVHIDI